MRNQNIPSLEWELVKSFKFTQGCLYHFIWVLHTVLTDLKTYGLQAVDINPW